MKLKNHNNLYVLVSGASKSGKDECIKEAMAKKTMGPKQRFCHQMAFSDVVKKEVIAFFDLPADINNRKDEPCDALQGHTFREACIIYSEDFMKPLLGLDIMAKKTFIKMMEDGIRNSIVFITGVGFNEEIDYLTSRVSSDMIIHCEVMRSGKTHNSDSRYRVKLKDSKNCLINNNGTKEQLNRQLLNIVSSFVKGYDS